MTRGGGVEDGTGKLGDERGMVILVVMILIVILSLIGLAAGRNVVTNMRIGANHVSSVKAFHAAEAAAERGFNDLFQELKKLNPNIGGLATPSVSGYTVSSANFFQPVGTRDTAGRVLTYGTYEGLTAYVQKYRINAQATEAANNGVGIIALEVEDQLIPIFQFGIFYGQDLEILPGATMTFSGGRIHSNSDIYLNPDGGTTDSPKLSIESKITSAGDIYHKRKDNSAAAVNPLRIRDSSGNYQWMNIDSDTSTWATDSQTTWGGTVKSSDNGVTQLTVPQDSGQPIDILGTGTGSMYSKAGLRIENGVLKNKSGTAISGVCETKSDYMSGSTLIIDPGCTSAANYNPVVRPGSMYDYREGRSVTTYDIDVAALQTKTNAMNALADPPAGGDPGILSVTSTDTSKAIRLINGASLPDSTHYTGGGLTVSTNNPLYVKGDYNTANRPAAVLADAVTILSSSWTDSYGSGTGLASRPAASTMVNAAIMSGNVATTGSSYSGGVENFMRFLENWSGDTFTFAGSIVCLWQSQYANHAWPGTGATHNVYNPPTRNWSYGINANNLPPGTPRVRYVLRLGFRQGTN